MQSRSEIRESFKFLLLASAVTLILLFIPFAEVITYPFRIFVTYIHEIGHATAATLTLGNVAAIGVNLDGSGVTWTSEGWRFLISSAGYISTTIYGAALLLLMQRARFARAAAIATGAMLLVVPVIFNGTFLAWLFGVTIGGGLLALGWKGRLRFVHFFMSFLAIQSLLNAFYDLRTLFYISAFRPGMQTDAFNMSQATGGLLPPIFWAVGWSIVSLAILGVTLFVYYKSLQQRAATSSIMPGVPLLDDPKQSVMDRSL
jgi:hypothetical protein